ncbi:MAG: hypothetical protein ABIP74_00115 [Candidatus Saccharimonas sp.]
MAPIAILVVGFLVNIMINLVGDVLMTQQRNVATYESQDGLNQIEQDVRLSVKIMQTTGTFTAPSYQGSAIASSASTNTGAFTASTSFDGSDTREALILRAYATTANPLSTNRTLVYTNQPGGSCPATYTSNDPLTYLIIYYMYSGSLWRRSVIPSATLCGGAVVWQKNSCAAAAATHCQTNDRLVANSVSSVNVTYYAATTDSSGHTTVSTTPMTQPTEDPVSVKVVINTSKTVAGGSITSTMSTYASRLNN